MSQTRMTLNDIITKVREVTELDSTDVPTSVITMYIRDGYNRVIDLERRWNFLECKFQMTTTVDVGEYDINDFTADDIREVISIVDDEGTRLEYISYDEAEDLFLDVTTPIKRPIMYSMWAGKIYLFPTPNAVYTATVRAYRYPNDWVTSGGTVDGPAAFDIPLVYYAVSRIYQAQEELATAGRYEQSFSDAISMARRDLTRPPSNTPVVFAGGTKKRLMRGSDWSY
jgi:hypothetical protein